MHSITARSAETQNTNDEQDPAITFSIDDVFIQVRKLWFEGNLGQRIGAVCILLIACIACFYLLGHTADAYFTPALQVCEQILNYFEFLCSL